MKLCEEPLVEIKGLHVLTKDKILPADYYRLSQLAPLFRNPMKSNRVAFSLTFLGYIDGFAYYVLAITPSHGKDFHRFTFYCGKGKAKHLWGSYIIETFKERSNGGLDVYLNHNKVGAEYNIDGCLSIYNVDTVNSYWLLKLQYPFRENKIMLENKGEPIIFTKGEKIRNYNYLIWGQRELAFEKEGTLLEEVKSLLKRRY